MKIIIRGRVDEEANGYRRFVYLGGHFVSLNRNDYFSFLALAVASKNGMALNSELLHRTHTARYIYNLRNEIVRQTIFDKKYIKSLVYNNRLGEYSLVHDSIDLQISDSFLERERKDDGRLDILLKYIDNSIKID